MQIDKKQASLITAILVFLMVGGLIYWALFTPLKWSFTALGPNGEYVEVTSTLPNPRVHLVEPDLWVPVGTVSRVMGIRFSTTGGTTIDEIDLGEIQYNISWAGWNVEPLYFLEVEYGVWGDAGRGGQFLEQGRFPWYPQDQDADYTLTISEQVLPNAAVGEVPASGSLSSSTADIPSIKIIDQVTKGWDVADGDYYSLHIGGRAVGYNSEPSTATLEVASHGGGALCDVDGGSIAANYASLHLMDFRGWYQEETLDFRWVSNSVWRAKLGGWFGEEHPVEMFWATVIVLCLIGTVLTISAIRDAEKPRKYWRI